MLYPGQGRGGSGAFPGKMGVSHEYTRGGMPVHIRAPHTHTLTFTPLDAKSTSHHVSGRKPERNPHRH